MACLLAKGSDLVEWKRWMIQTGKERDKWRVQVTDKSPILQKRA
jgi:hypothetical protein